MHEVPQDILYQRNTVNSKHRGGVDNVDFIDIIQSNKFMLFTRLQLLIIYIF